MHNAIIDHTPWQKIKSRVDIGLSVHTVVLDFLTKCHSSSWIKKLLDFGFSDSIIQSVQSFVTDRYQRVVLEGVCSGVLKVT